MQYVCAVDQCPQRASTEMDTLKRAFSHPLPLTVRRTDFTHVHSRFLDYRLVPLTTKRTSHILHVIPYPGAIKKKNYRILTCSPNDLL